MIHPDTELRLIDPAMGYGVFATAFIPEGTIVYIKDSLEVELSESDYAALNSKLKEAVDKYSYKDERGYRIVSWDHAKYVNHCCNCNTMSTGYGFEIALRDIYPFEQITDEYGLFNIDEPMQLSCNEPHCRKVVSNADIDVYHEAWDQKVMKALLHFHNVDQPLLQFIDPDILKDLKRYMKNGKNYRSVKSLKFTSSEGLDKTLSI